MKKEVLKLTKTLTNYYNDENIIHHPNAYKNSVYRLEEYLSKNYPNGNSIRSNQDSSLLWNASINIFYYASSKNLGGLV